MSLAERPHGAPLVNAVSDAMDLVFYSNERVFQVDESYFGWSQAYTDFGAALCRGISDGKTQLAAPCKQLSKAEAKDLALTPLELDPAWFHPLPYIENRYQSAFRAIQLARALLSQIDTSRPVLLALPSTNSVAFWLSLMAPKSCKLVFFMRGNTVETLRQIYRGRLLGPLVLAYAKALRWNELRLHRKGRAQIVAYGSSLAQLFQDEARPALSVAPILDPIWLATTPPARPPSDRVRLLFCGRLSAEKNVTHLVRTVASLVAEGQDVHLTLIGDGPDLAAVQQIIDAKGLADRVHLAGHVAFGPEFIAMFDQHDILCLPSSTEGTPRVIVEAMARGLIVVATPVGSVPDMVPGLVQMSQQATVESFEVELRQVLKNRRALAAKAQEQRLLAQEFALPEQAAQIYAKLLDVFAEGRP
jgi:glycosyltransferase involved in cell wall biosynthesis